MLDNLTMTQFVHNTDARIRGARCLRDPDRFFIASRLRLPSIGREAAEHFPFDICTDITFMPCAGSVSAQERCNAAFTTDAHVTHANLDETGAIASVSTKEGTTIAADLFVDCTGFAGC